MSHPNPLNVRLRKFLYCENLIFNLNIYYEEDLLLVVVIGVLFGAKGQIMSQYPETFLNNLRRGLRFGSNTALWTLNFSVNYAGCSTGLNGRALTSLVTIS